MAEYKNIVDYNARDPGHEDPDPYMMHNGDRIPLRLKIEDEDGQELDEVPSYLEETSKIVSESISIKELLATRFPETTYVVDGLLPSGSAILAAPAKTGKSWMMLQLSLAAAEGSFFLGKRVKRCHVLYYALEDSDRRLQKRLYKMLGGQAPPDGIEFITRAPGIHDGLLDEIRERIQKDPEIKLVIVDTLQKVKPPSSAKLSAYEQDYNLFGNITDLAHDKDSCLLFLHHLRKSNGFRNTDPFENILGSTALQGSTDTMMVMEREDRTNSEAMLHITGRDIEPQDLVLQFRGYQWENLGDADSMERMRAEKAYRDHPAIITLKKKLDEIEADPDEPVKEYIVRAKDFREDVIKETGQVVGTSERNFMTIVKEFDIYLLNDGIEHVEPDHNKPTTYKGRKGKFHRYKYSNRSMVV